MDLTTTNIGLSRWRRRRWLLYLSATAISSYGAYKFYNLPYFTRKRQKLTKLVTALFSLSDAVTSSSDAVSLVAGDLHRFLLSDSDEVPRSLKQISKIACSDDFSRSVSSISEALTAGIVRGIGSGTESNRNESGTFTDRVLDKLFSDAGTGFVSVIAGSFARNLVLGFYVRSYSSNRLDGEVSAESEPQAVPKWVQLVCRDESRELIADCIERFVSTAVDVFLDKTMDINMYDQIFSGLTNPEYESKMKEMLVSVCNGAMETLVRTSHEVLTSSNLNSSNHIATIEGDRALVTLEHNGIRRHSFEGRMKGQDGLMNQVSTTLAIPKNRKFVLDVTGRITSETVRSFLDFMMWKLCDGAKRGADVVHEQTIRKGIEVMRYVNAKSVVIATICLALCMHILIGTRVLTPA